MLKTYGRLRPRHLLAFPLAVLLWPLIAWNYRRRAANEAPDEWHWADALLLRLGFAVSLDSNSR